MMTGGLIIIFVDYYQVKLNIRRKTFFIFQMGVYAVSVAEFGNDNNV